MAQKTTGTKRSTRQTTGSTRSTVPRTRKTVSGQTRSTARPRGRGNRPAHGATPAGASASTLLTTTAKAVGRALGQTTAAISDRLPWNGKDDALDLLEQDHRRLEALLEQGTKIPDDDPQQRTALVATLSRELAAHELVEEKILYPELKAHAEARDIVLEGYQEHHVADLVLDELRRMPPADERWAAKLKVLKENIEHHIEEEEGEMFKTARSILDRSQLQKIGVRMQALKDQHEHAPSSRKE